MKGKIVFHGKIETLSPLHIGCGADDRSDMDVLLDSKGKPFIPATSFVGVLNHAIDPFIKDSDRQQYKTEIKNFWGYSKGKDGHQSTFRCADLLCQSSPKIVIRDGIRIDNKTGMVKDKGKYDYELIERETVFDLKMEFGYKKSDEALVRKMVTTIYFLLKNKKIQIGAKTNSGLGKIRLLENETKIYLFDFSKKEDTKNWLINQHSSEFSHKNKILPTDLGMPFELKHKLFSINATLELKNSLIIRSYSEDPEMPDAVHLKSLEDLVLTGTSLKGAIRARAERIVKTLGASESIITELFGNVDDENRSKNARKGKIQVSEVVLPRFIAEQQTRIKIDRFTGGTIETALFDTMPLFPDMNDKVVKINICIREYKEIEAGLLLLVLKDLWTGDLAVGGEKNIGRGVFQGINAFIRFDDEEIIFSPENREKLQTYVDALITEKPS